MGRKLKTKNKKVVSKKVRNKTNTNETNREKSLKKAGFVKSEENKTENYNYWWHPERKYVFKDTDKDGRIG